MFILSTTYLKLFMYRSLFQMHQRLNYIFFQVTCFQSLKLSLPQFWHCFIFWESVSFQHSTALKKQHANEQLLYQEVQSSGYGAPTRYLDGTAFLRRMSVAEAEKELDGTSNASHFLTENLSQRPLSLPLKHSLYLFLLRSISMDIQKYKVLLRNMKQCLTLS